MEGGDIDELIDEILRTDGPAQPNAATTATATTVAAAASVPSKCWGMQITGVACAGSPGSTPAGYTHMKDRFCPSCRSSGIVLPADRLCVLTPSMQETFSNTATHTPWTRGARLVNQTVKCSGQPVAIFKDNVPAETRAQGASFPSEWLFDDATTGCPSVRFIISKGTLVPVRSTANAASATSGAGPSSA